MIIRQPGSCIYKCLFLALISLFAPSNAFTFSFSSQPSQCQSLTAQWSGGQGPYRLFLIPVGHVNPEIRTIVNMEIPANQSSSSLTLQFPENSQFVAVMSDSTGFGTGGTSTIYTVGSGPTECLPSSPSKADFYMYFANKVPSQCGSFGITWDGGVSDIHIYGVIPGGQSFDLGAPTTGTGFDWTANVRQGTQMLFLAVGANNANGGSSDVTTVSSGSSGCINAQSPSSTAGPPAGGVSTAAPPASGSPTQSVANPTQPAGSASATGSSGATGATGSSGATGTAGATVTGSPGGSPTASGSPPASSGNNGGNNSASGTPGSGGGTVTGDPNLPLATGNTLSSHHPLNLGAIIGGTLGGLTAILLLILLWLLCARRRRANQDDDSERLIAQSNHRRTDLLADSVPIMRQDSSYGHDWFRAEPFVPPMSAEEFARRTGGGGGSVEHDEHEEYRDYDDQDQSMSSLGHGAVTNSSAAAAMYGALARTPSYSTSGHGHRGSTQPSHSRLSHSRSQSLSHSHSHSHSHNVSHSPPHSPTHSSSRHSATRTHSRSFSNPFSFSTFTPTSNVSRTRQEVTPPTPMSSADPFAAAVSRPPPSSWNNQASGSSNVVPRAITSNESNRYGIERKSGEEDEENESIQEGDVVDIPPSYASLKPSSRRVMNP
ncbi:HlyIII domain-containing protein [Ceratobasidium sp. AG-Ba]|nr:HlyIII domain-containing protein [Ceratobasidium sp. AG-Ba]